jgi:hypothetical protein
MIEGYLLKGIFTGFARVIEVVSSTKINVKMGYFQNKNGMMVPHGKFQWLQITEDSVHTICPMGIYASVFEGFKVRIVSCPSFFFKDFDQNQEPEDVPKINLKKFWCCSRSEAPIYLNYD